MSTTYSKLGSRNRMVTSFPICHAHLHPKLFLVSFYNHKLPIKIAYISQTITDGRKVSIGYYWESGVSLSYGYAGFAKWRRIRPTFIKLVRFVVKFYQTQSPIRTARFYYRRPHFWPHTDLKPPYLPNVKFCLFDYINDISHFAKYGRDRPAKGAALHFVVFRFEHAQLKPLNQFDG